MSIVIGNVTKCFVCGEEPNKKEHECLWVGVMESKIIDVMRDASEDQWTMITSFTRGLILDAYHRGRKDGSSNLTPQQEIMLDNLSQQLQEAQSALASLRKTP